MTKLIDEGHVNAGALKRMLIHAIEADGSLCDLNGLSKLNADWKFLTGLPNAGRERANRCLVESLDSLNVESTVDIADKYL